MDTTSVREVKDLVIIGGGGAGLAAALQAAQCGVGNLVILEKRPFVGGNSGMAGGWVFGAESRLQREAGNNLTKEEIFRKAMEFNHYNRINTEIYRTLIMRSAFTVDWLQELGIEYKVTGDYTHMPSKIDTPFGYFRKAINLMKDKITAGGGEIITNVTALKIMRDNDGKISGVAAKDNKTGGEFCIETKAVVLSSGGFVGNDDLLCKYFPDQYSPETYLTDAIPLMGDGVKLAEDLGAATADYCTLLKEPNYSFKKRNNAPNRIGGLSSAIWVNKNGERYICEDIGDTVAGHANAQTNLLVKQPGRVGFAIFDEDMIERLATGERLPLLMFQDMSGIKEFLESEAPEWTCISEDLGEIAEWIGAEPEALKKTVAEYNEACEQGFDGKFGKTPERLIPIKRGPFYAIKFCPLIIDTFGPVIVDAKMQVLDRNKRPIPGMYAGGVITSGWQGEDYFLSGSALGLSLATGILAGETAASYIAEESL